MAIIGGEEFNSVVENLSLFGVERKRDISTYSGPDLIATYATVSECKTIRDQ